MPAMITHMQANNLVMFSYSEAQYSICSPVADRIIAACKLN